MKKSLLLLILSFTFILIPQGEAFPRLKAGGPIISRIDADLELLTLDPEKIKELIPINKGDSFTEAKLGQAVETLKNTNLFETVEATTQKISSGIFITFHLIEARLIHRVKVSGNYPYLSRKILRLSSLQPGIVYREELVGESKKRLEDFFEKQGYFDTQVEILPPVSPAPNMVDLRIRIHKGRTYRIGKIEVTGNQFYRSSYLRNRIYGFSHFNPYRIKDKLKGVQNSYINNGFVRARVKLTDIEINPQSHHVDLAVAVDERKQLQIVFKGNQFFRPGTLERQVTFYKERGYDRFAVERSTKKITDFYRLNGFLEASATANLDRQTELTLVTFTIHEGPRTRLKNIKFKGNKSISARYLVRVMTNQQHTITQQGLFQEENVPIDLEKIIDFYKAEGFFDAQISHCDIQLNGFHDQAVLTVEINEGQPTVIDQISFEGNTLLDETQLIKKSNLKTKKNLQEDKLENAKVKIITYYTSQGFPHATLDFIKKPSNDSHHINLIGRLNEGVKTRIRNIIIDGHLLTNRSVIEEALKFETGDIYSYKKILDAQLNLKRLGIFDYVRVQTLGLDENHQDVDIVVNLQERKDKTLDIQAGFDSERLGSGQVILTKRNLFGLAKQIQLRGLASFELDRAELTFYSPRLFGASWNLVNQYFGEYQNRPNFNATSYGGSLGTIKNFGPDWTLLLKEQVSRFILGAVNNDILASHFFNSTFSEASGSVIYDTRNNFADPQKGIYAIASTEFDTDLADVTNNFNITNLKISDYMGFLKRLTFINTFRLGTITALSKNPRIPANKLFFLGGNNSIRGFDEDAINPAGGTTSLIYNTELDFRLFSSLKVAGFFDMGSLTNAFGDISADSLRESAGVGLRYITPVGPIRLDYGFVLDKKPGETGHRLHFTFGYMF